jgi:anaerobic magnesium-protoporphyrin IX monomethyl ester cyclase
MLMRTILVGPELEENLSIAYLRGAIRAAGHECFTASFNHDDDAPRVARAVLRRHPDAVGLSLVAQRRYGGFQQLAARLRRGGFTGHITAGGHFAALRAPEVLRDTPAIDSILHHDGEERIVRLLGLLGSGLDLPGDLDGVSWRRAEGTIGHRPAIRVADLDALPLPARRRPDRTLGFARAPIVSSRGCSGACSFCSIHAWHKQVPRGRLRFRAPDSVAAEMIALHRQSGVRLFVFHDDDFCHPVKDTARERCARILGTAQRGIGGPLAFVIKCRPDDVEEDLFRYLKHMGLVRAYVGIETHAPSGLAALNRRVTPATNLRALDTLRRAGIYACFNLLLFHPETTLEELRENLDFLQQHVHHPFDVARTELYAFSELEQRMLREGRAMGDYRGFDYHIADDRAEAAFRLFARSLWERHFGGDSILHRVQDLGLRLGLLARFHPELACADLAARVESLIVDVNTDTVDYLRQIVAAAADHGGAALAGAEALRQEVKDRTRSHTVRWAALSLEIEGRGLLGRVGLARSRRAAHLPRLVGRFAGAAPFAGLALCSLACPGSDNGMCDPAPPPVLSFADDIEPALAQGCTASGCHAAETPAANLVLASGASYAQTVGVPSTQAPALERIEPGEPGQSYLLDKLEGTQASVGGTGEQMPKGGPVDTELIRDLKYWIGDGAEEN